MSDSERAAALTPEEEQLRQEVGFSWDLVIQLARLRSERGLTQHDLAEAVHTKQQAISRLEKPRYDRQSLRMLRDVARALDAYIDIAIVPREKVQAYLNSRYQPVLDTAPPTELPSADLTNEVLNVSR